MITTKMSFTYGRFEVRAALPKGKMLLPFLELVNSGEKPKASMQSWINFFWINQTIDLRNGFGFKQDSKYHYFENDFKVSGKSKCL